MKLQARIAPQALSYEHSACSRVPVSAAAEVFPENDRGQLKTLFGLEKVEKAVGKGGAKRFWREAPGVQNSNFCLSLQSIQGPLGFGRVGGARPCAT